MEFEWDEDKRQHVMRTRSADILYAALIFDGEVLTKIDARQDYGEMREISLGVVDGGCFVVVHTRRSGRTRLITAWKGGRADHEQYEKGIARQHQDDASGG